MNLIKSFVDGKTLTPEATENANARSSATLSVWCLMRSMKLNGRSASSGNSPSYKNAGCGVLFLHPAFLYLLAYG